MICKANDIISQNPIKHKSFFQKFYTKYLLFMSVLYHRRNVHLQKQPDVVIIASYIWAIQEGWRNRTT